MEMFPSFCGLLCLFAAVSAFDPHQIPFQGISRGKSASGRLQRGQVSRIDLSTSIPSVLVSLIADTEAKDPKHYHDLLGKFSVDLERLATLRPPIPSADTSAVKTIISVESSYTRLWSHSTWKGHASPPHVRYARHVWNWPKSTTFRRILPAVLMSVLWAAIVSVVAKTFPRFGIHILAQRTGASASVSALSAPLALLLTLRANASMSRLLEARTAWARLTLHSRSLANLLQVYLIPLEPEAAILAARHLSMLGWIFKAKLRGEGEEAQQEVLRTMLSGEDYSWLSSQQANRPIAITSRVRQITAFAFARSPAGYHWNNPLAFVEDHIHQLEAAIGVSERIFSSPIPPTYSRHLSRVMALWSFLMPINLVALGFTTSGVILATTISSYVFIGIDEVGMEIERPSLLLPLQELAGGLQNAVRDQIVLEGGGGMPQVP
jgi:putative membrane protein